MKDFFISYNRNDRDWAEWIAWALEEADYSVVIQAWDFRPGSNFVLEMQAAMTQTERTIAVLSDSYLSTAYTQPEWAAAFARDPKGDRRRLIPVRVADCRLIGIWETCVYVDLVGLAEADARAALLTAVSPRDKPLTAPPYPGSGTDATILSAERLAPDRKLFPGCPSPLASTGYQLYDDLLNAIDAHDFEGSQLAPIIRNACQRPRRTRVLNDYMFQRVAAVIRAEDERITQIGKGAGIAGWRDDYATVAASVARAIAASTEVSSAAQEFVVRIAQGIYDGQDLELMLDPEQEDEFYGCARNPQVPLDDVILVLKSATVTRRRSD